MAMNPILTGKEGDQYYMSQFIFHGALEDFKKNKDSDQLLSLYSEIPGGTCDSCGKCCYDNVPLSAAEFLAIVNYLLSSGDGELSKAIAKVSDWYIHQFERVQACIFLQEDNRCGVYTNRPLVCRLFGHQSPQEQARRKPIVLEQNKALAKAVKEAYGIIIAQACVDHVIEQCYFIPAATYEKDHQDALFERVTQVDLPYYNSGALDLDYINLSLIEWFVLAFLEEDLLLDQILSKV